MALFTATQRVLSLGLIGLGLSVGVGCDGGGDCDPATDATCAEGTGGTDPGTTSDPGTQGPAPFVPSWFFVEGQFGYDQTTDQGRPYVAGTDAVNPAIAITLAEEAYTTTFDDAFTCIVYVEYAGNIDMASWTTNANAIFGVTMPADAAVQSDCDPARFDALVWGDDPVATVMQWVWGIGIKDMSADMKAELKSAVDAEPTVDWATDFEPYVVGGGFYMNGLEGNASFPGGFAETALGNGFAVDSNFTVLVDSAGEGTPLLAADINSGTMPSGAYVTRTFYLLSGAEALAGGM